MLKWFMERLAERLVPLIAASFSSTVETLHALGQAEQQSDLEEAARRYEADGKTDIAQTLRKRAAALTSGNPAAEAVDIFENVASEGRQLLPPADRPSESDLARLPDLGGRPLTSSRKKTRRKSASGNDGSDDTATGP